MALRKKNGMHLKINELKLEIKNILLIFATPYKVRRKYIVEIINKHYANNSTISKNRENPID